MATLALYTPPTTAVDTLRSGKASALLQSLAIAGFALLTALFARFEIQLYLWEVPLTLQTVAVYSSGLFLGWRGGLAAMLLYLVLGLFLPFYAGATSGFEHFLGASGGYLLGFPLAAATIGLVSRRLNTVPGSVLATLAGSLVLFSLGVTWLHFAADHATWWESIDKGWLRFVAWDLTKVALVGALYGTARRLTA